MNRILLFISLLFITFSLYAKSLTPFDFGFSTAKSGEERFWVLYNTHVEALRQGKTVDYSGIERIDLIIPSDAKSIPLGNYTDFRSVSFNVLNTRKDNFVLFVMTNEAKDIRVDKSCFTSFDFRSYPELRSGYTILIVEDENPWVESRIGFNYGAIRKDVLLLRNGIAVNRPVSPYDNEESMPRCKYVVTTNVKKSFKNIVFNRNKASTAKTLLLTVRNVNNIEVRNISIHTPKNEELYADQIILFEGCSNVKMKNVYVDNTYSQTDKFGYAFGLNPVLNVTLENINASADWGVFACSNLNKATLKNCNINRFDLHCYGRDYHLSKCTITGGMPISSMYGDMKFDRCVFEYAFPCNYRYDYNSYTPFDLSFRNCIFKMDKEHNFILYISQLSENRNMRKELYEKCLPNISLKNCTIEVEPDVTTWDVVHIGDNYYPQALGYISNITIEGLKIIGNAEKIQLATHEIETQSPVFVEVKKMRSKNVEYIENINKRRE